MSNKREWAATLFPSGVPFTEMLNDNARFVTMRRERFSTCPEFPDRSSLYRHLAKMVDEPIDYFEFGVWQGASIKEWALLNSHAGSRFLGFDTFEGLPEDWDAHHPKGTFSTHGQTPPTDDQRIKFTPGLFQDTLRSFVEHMPPKQRLVVNVDCDLYSASLFVLGTLDRFFSPGSIIVFDDFYSMGEEFKAFYDYSRSFGRQWKALGRMPHCVKAAIEIRS
jgi:hypothetical protein